MPLLGYQYYYDQGLREEREREKQNQVCFKCVWKMTSDIGSLVGAIDQGTSSTRFIVFSATNGFVATYHQVEVKRHYPREGWVEQDPNELFESVLETSQVVWQKLSQLNIDPNQLKCIGLTNQRESTIVWDKVTGR